MKRFFIVKNETLIKQVKDFESMRNKVNDAFIEFAKEHDIKTRKFYRFTDKLRIIPTRNDLQKFNDQLRVDKQTFKKNSTMGKSWVKVCKENELKTVTPPSWECANLADEDIYKFRCSLFSLGDKVYGTLEVDEPFNLSEEHFVELKASEFYKTIEEYEEKEGEQNGNDSI